jgi:cyclic dehypoxanthinyl futalosine synthase
MISRDEALDFLRSDDLIGIGMAADAVRRRLHPEAVVLAIIDRNINYTNFCTEYCSFCAFYRPRATPKATSSQRIIFDKIQETIDLGGTGILMQGGLHPDLKIDWYEDLLGSIKQRFEIHCLFFSASRSPTSPTSAASIRDTVSPAVTRARFHSRRRRGDFDDAVRHRISRP